MKNKHVFNIVKTALFAALCCVATMLIAIPLPGGGYANLGDVMVIASGVFLGPVYGFAAAAIGSALADVFAGYVLYAPATFLIKGIMALIIGLMMKTKIKLIIIPSAFIAETVMVLGYFVFEIFIYDIGVAVADIMGNVVQGSVGMVIGCLLICVLRANKKIRNQLMMY